MTTTAASAGTVTLGWVLVITSGSILALAGLVVGMVVWRTRRAHRDRPHPGRVDSPAQLRVRNTRRLERDPEATDIIPTTDITPWEGQR